MDRRHLLILAIAEGVLIVLLGWSLWSLQGVPVADSSPVQAAVEQESIAAAPEGERAPKPRTVDAEQAPVAAPQSGTESRAPSLAVLFGRIHTSDGSTISQGAVAITRNDVADAKPNRISFSRTQPEFAVPGLEPGSYTLTTGSTGYRNLTETVEIAAGVDHLRHDILLQKTWDLLVLIVTPEGVPLMEAFADLKRDRSELMFAEIGAIATPTPPPSPIPDVTLRMPDIGIGRWNGGSERVMDGRSRPPKRYAGVLELPVDLPLYVSATLRSAVLATARVEPGQKEVQLVVPLSKVTDSLCTVHLRVIDATDDAPVSGARVSLTDLQSESPGVATDAEGRGVLHSKPGRLRLNALAKDRASPPWDLDLLPGADVDLGNVVVRAPVKVRLQCEGAPADKKPSVYTRCLDPVPLPVLRNSWKSAYLQDGATGVETSLYPGRYAARGTVGSMMATAEFDTATQGDRPVTMHFAEAAVLHVIPPPLDRPVGLALTDGNGTSAWNRQISWEGAFDIVLQPGTYTAAIRKPDATTEPRTLTLAVGTTELDLR